MNSIKLSQVIARVCNSLRVQVFGLGAVRYSSFECGPNDPESEIHHFDGPMLPLPEYPFKENEPLEKKRNRLVYQSRKRGMLENDLLLGTFAAKFLKTMNKEQVEQYDKLINGPSNDWDIYYWATNAKPVPEEYQSDVMKMLIEHTANKNKEKRFRMPDLDIDPKTSKPSK